MAGVEVVVVVEAIYNGPNHKSLGMCAPGQTIVVAGGPYVQSLLDSGLVVMRADALIPPGLPVVDDVDLPAEAAATLFNALVTIAAEPPPPDNGHLLLTESGINERLARLVYDAGFRSKEAIAATYSDFGTAKLTEIQGIGLNSAIKLVRWAGIEPEMVI